MIPELPTEEHGRPGVEEPRRVRVTPNSGAQPVWLDGTPEAQASCRGSPAASRNSVAPHRVEVCKESNRREMSARLC